MTRTITIASTMLLAVGLTACAGADQRGSPAHRLSVWVGGTGLGASIGTLEADNQRVPKDVPNGTGAVHAACGTLEVDAEMANQVLPAPDAEVTELLTAAYGLEGSAGVECYNAGSTDTTQLAKAQRDMTKAEALFAQVLARIQVVDGQSVATTTTTDNTPGGPFG
jgi:hypothetical protein